MGRNTDSIGHSDEVSDQNDQQVLGQWRKGRPCYKVAKNLADLCLWSSLLRKVQLASNGNGCLLDLLSMAEIKNLINTFNLIWNTCRNTFYDSKST